MNTRPLPYQLRPNKAIDRSIFMEFLSKLNVVQNLRHYRYIGLGGLHFEDFRLIHSMFAIDKMTCIENNETTHYRQFFNKPLRSVVLKKMSTGEFINHEWVEMDESPVIVWLDYVVPNELDLQISEFQDVLRKSASYDVVKITINANPTSLYDSKDGESARKKQEKRLAELEDRVGDWLPNTTEYQMMTRNHLPGVLCNVLDNAARQALSGHSNLEIIPVSSFIYVDSSHPMLTYTVILIPAGTSREFLFKTGLDTWDFLLQNNLPQVIDVPELTIKEKIELDSRLPYNEHDHNYVDTIARTFDRKFDRRSTLLQNEIKSYIENYVTYYRHYPQFIKMGV
jgi:hypothetical protein